MSVETLTPSSTAEWLSLRNSTVGASEAATVLGADPYQTPYELWARKSGRLPLVEETKQMRRGKKLEPVAIEILREERPEWTIIPNSLP